NSFDGRFTNTFGKVAFEKRYHVAYDFSEGLALVSEEWTGKWGYINTAGDSVITPRFEYASSFSDGLAAIELNHRWRYIDRTGSIVIPPQFVFAGNFHEGMARVTSQGPCSQVADRSCASRG